jgi:hypothetical protein
MRKDGDLRRHAVLQGVELRFQFAFFGLRAGGALRVPAVCFDLFLRSHPDCRVQAGLGENGVAKIEVVEKMENIEFLGRAPGRTDGGTQGVKASSPLRSI